MNTEIVKIRILDDSAKASLKRASEIICRGGLVIFPTETVYGLGADATNASAVSAIYTAKGRPSDNPLIIHIATPEDAEKYTYTCELYYELARAFMPGPLTVILKSRDIIPSRTRGGLETVAVRCPSNVIARELISHAGVPIAAPSANISGTPSPTVAQHVIDDMMGRVDMIIDGGDSDFGLESTIVKIEDDFSLTLLRPGKITLDDLKQITHKINIAPAVTDKLADGEKALSPGMKYRHYAPTSPVVLLDGEALDCIKFIRSADDDKPAVLVYTEDKEIFENSLSAVDCYDFGFKEREEEQAHRLFSILREADKKNYSVIYAPLPRRDGIGLALYNRMIRAAAHKIIRLRR